MVISKIRNVQAARGRRADAEAVDHRDRDVGAVAHEAVYHMRRALAAAHAADGAPAHALVGNEVRERHQRSAVRGGDGRVELHRQRGAGDKGDQPRLAHGRERQTARAVLPVLAPREARSLQRRTRKRTLAQQAEERQEASARPLNRAPGARHADARTPGKTPTR